MGKGAANPALHLLLFSSTILLVVAQTDFLSIDCGAPEAYVDTQTGILWVSDGNYIDSGVNAKVANQSILKSLRTLRYFPNSNSTNCYLLPVKTGTKYFFRAIFFYGNYDAKQSWPSFFLSFNGGNWTYEIIGTNYLLDQSTSVDVVFKPKQGQTSVDLCLSSNDFVNNVPFISSLELRPLPYDFYSDDPDFKDSTLRLRLRRYFNEDPTAIVRFPGDQNDRMWYPSSYVPPYANRVRSNISTISGFTNRPPAEVLVTALEGKQGSVFNYTVSLGRLDSDVLFYFYFFEVRSNRTATDVREFNLVVSSASGSSPPDKVTILPQDGLVAIFWGSWGSYDDAELAFSLIPTSNSTLTPILNALEIFTYNEPSVVLPVPSPPTPTPTPLPPSPPLASQKKSSIFSIGAIVGVALGGVVVLICLVLIVSCKMKKPGFKNGIVGPTQYSYPEIEKMTNNFGEKIGHGGYADVYKGFTSGAPLAVKVIKTTGNEAREARDFDREISVLSVIHHLNLVDFVGYCADETKMILVYKFMENGSLDKWIFNNSANPLSWVTRFNIITGIASGMTYLHEQCENIVLHLDLKPQNILLNKKFIPKVADFGISKLLDRDQSMTFTQTIRGSPLYIAPECMLGAGLNAKMDVYSFGIIMLEILAGRHLVDLSGLAVEDAISGMEKKDFFPLELVDNVIHTSIDETQVKGVMQIAFLCLLIPDERPTISSILHMLEGRIPIPTLSAPQKEYLSYFFASKRSSGFMPLMTYSTSVQEDFSAPILDPVTYSTSVEQEFSAPVLDPGR